MRLAISTLTFALAAAKRKLEEACAAKNERAWRPAQHCEDAWAALSKDMSRR